MANASIKVNALPTKTNEINAFLNLPVLENREVYLDMATLKRRRKIFTFWLTDKNL